MAGEHIVMKNMDIHKLFKRLLLSIVMAMMAVAGIIIYADAGNIYAAMAQISNSYLLRAGLFAFCIYLGRFFKWYVFLRVLHIRVPIREAGLVFLAGLCMGLTPGKVGEVIKSYLLDKIYNVPFAETSPTILAERLTGVLGCILVCILSLAYTGYSSEYTCYLAVGFALIVIFTGLLSVYCGRHVSILDAVCRIKYFGRFRQYVEQFCRSTVKLLGIRIILLGISISAVYWFMECMVFYTLLSGLGESIPLSKAISILTLVSIGGGLTMLPGSVGALEGGLLSILLYDGMSAATAGCVVLLHRFYAMWSVVIIGSAIMLAKYRNAFR